MASMHKQMSQVGITSLFTGNVVRTATWAFAMMYPINVLPQSDMFDTADGPDQVEEQATVTSQYLISLLSIWSKLTPEIMRRQYC